MAGLKTKEGLSPLAVGVSLGTTLLKRTKHNTWPELVGAIQAGDEDVAKVFQTIDLTPRQLGLINAAQPVLNLVSITPAVTAAICPECGMFILVSGTAPSGCSVTLDCPGKPAKVSAATGSKDPIDDEDLPVPEDYGFVTDTEIEIPVDEVSSVDPESDDPDPIAEKHITPGADEFGDESDDIAAYLAAESAPLKFNIEDDW